MQGGSVALEIFITGLGERAEGSPVEGVNGTNQQLVGFCCRLPTMPCTFCPGSGEVQKVLEGKTSSKQYGQN